LSRIKRSGLVKSARPIVSICCSPPESCPHRAEPLGKARKRCEGARRSSRRPSNPRAAITRFRAR
jgi:hypothetical protein